ncbi:MAG: glyoxalase [Acidimicrobiia bacterium]|nr:glyoxalase [Acidimicrobiia bacterium]MBA3983803.1 glyoxalase [Acidimicrobiia bacterium]
MYTTIRQVSAVDKPRWIGIDHVQLAMPVGAEDQARAFYTGVLALTEVPKPEPLRARGGCWFEAGSVKLHLGAEDDFRPARKAHPALLVDDLRALVRTTGIDITWSDELPEVRRGYVDDPFGNRIELIEAP